LSLVAIVARDLIIATRIGDAARAAGHEALRVEAPGELPPPSEVTAVFVDWAARDDAWADQLRPYREAERSGAGPRLVIFGPHTDVAAHRAAREAAIGPMIARSKLVADLPDWFPAATSAR
jgi:hypothetical protein